MGDLFRGGNKTARTFENMITCAKSLDEDRKKTIDTAQGCRNLSWEHAHHADSGHEAEETLCKAGAS